MVITERIWRNGRRLKVCTLVQSKLLEIAQKNLVSYVPSFTCTCIHVHLYGIGTQYFNKPPRPINPYMYMYTGIADQIRERFRALRFATKVASTTIRRKIPSALLQQETAFDAFVAAEVSGSSPYNHMIIVRVCERTKKFTRCVAVLASYSYEFWVLPDSYLVHLFHPSQPVPSNDEVFR